MEKEIGPAVDSCEFKSPAAPEDIGIGFDCESDPVDGNEETLDENGKSSLDDIGSVLALSCSIVPTGLVGVSSGDIVEVAALKLTRQMTRIKRLG